MSTSHFSLLSKRKDPATLPFKHYYKNWFHALKNTLLPILDESLSTPSSPTLLSSHVLLILHHFLSYYDSLDLFATTDINNLPCLLYPSWRNSIERPFLFLGDLHPYVFTNLVRSFLDKENSDDDLGTSSTANVVVGRHWKVVMAWKEPSDDLIVKIEQIERGLRLMVPALMDRVRNAQAGVVRRLAEDWLNFNGDKGRIKIDEAVKVEMEELVSVFVDVNRLRKDVISEIVGALNVYQGALFLDGLAQFLVGFKDLHLLREIEGSKTPILD
ncbi:hypothetical protein K2173_018183 [Erythroxylum novogranatense]|uniref:DOG1 domain-containing protein n=1 Tax=Erythroxylum novogranatense TaxID=1862640 RepID=A0AAV8TNT5_9ROSI|nr:hypothetical protein K2173_018183 [Erythroxylum novogranatense]